MIDVKESVQISPQVSTFLTEKLRNARFSHELIADIRAGLDDLNWPGFEYILNDAARPTRIAVKRGDFGEVLCGLVLEEFDGYVIPVSKLRFKQRRDQLLQGTDLLAMKLDDDEIVEMCYVESKLRTSFTRADDYFVAVNGTKQLVQDRDSKLPDILLFVAERLRETSHRIYKSFLGYLRNRSDSVDLDSFCLALCTSSETWDEVVLTNLDESNVDLTPLSVVHIQIDRLGPLSDELFAAIGVSNIQDDD